MLPISNTELFIKQITKEVIQEIKKIPNAEWGFDNTNILDITNRFKFNKTGTEKVLEGHDNTYIVFGRDRLGTEGHGYGGKAHLKSGAIDIVAGRLSALNSSEIPEDAVINANTKADAARIYISQKSDIDNYFLLPEGLIGESKARSAIAIKADDVRIIARNTLKIITKTDDKNSNDTLPYANVGVQLIAGNDSKDLQPIPKGSNLISAFIGLSESYIELHGLLTEFVNIQKYFNSQITVHEHFTSFRGDPTSKSPQTLIDGKKAALKLLLKIESGLAASAWNLQKWQTDYLTVIGEKYINSKFHHLN